MSEFNPTQNRQRNNVLAENNCNMPLVVVGCPVYNAERTLTEAIESILNQDYENVLLIICDNASTDKTEEICRSYVNRDKRVRYYKNEVNIGAINNFKKVFDLSDSEYFMWLAHDDYIDKTYISKCLKKLMENPSAVSCCSDIVIIDENRKERTDMFFSGIDTTGLSIPNRVKALVSRGLFWYEIYALYRSEYIKKINLTIPKHAADVINLLELMLMGEVIKVPEKLFYYSFIPAQKSHEGDMANIAVGAKAPERPYTYLLNELYSTVINSDIDEKDKIEIYKIFVEYLPALNPSWMNCLFGEHNLPLEPQKVFLRGLLKDPRYITINKEKNSSETDKNLKIVHLASFPFGGAGIAALRLHKEMLDMGINSNMLVLQKRTDEPGIEVLATDFPKDIFAGGFDKLDNLNKLDIRWNVLYQSNPKRPQGLEMFSDTFSITDLLNEKIIQDADIINLHWVAGLLDYKVLANLSRKKVVFWTLHDMNPFTGGCHYAGDCAKYLTECGECPQLGSEYYDDASNIIWNTKNTSYKKSEVHIISPSKWLAGCAEKSALFSGFSTDVIHNGIKVESFKPTSKQVLRKKYNIPENSKVILFGADSIMNKRKGFLYLLEALNKLSGTENIVLSIFGNLKEDINTSLPVLNHGTVTGSEKLAEIYNLADVFVLPSLEDNLPNTAIEALACGTPVVAFDIGGLPDIIEHKKTGFLAKFKDIDSLAEGINWILESENPEEISKNCREKALKDFDIKKQTEKYLQKYTEYLKPKNKAKKLNEADIVILTKVTEELKVLLQEKRYDTIGWALEGLLATYSEYPDLLELKAEIEFYKGNKIEALELLQQLLEKNSANSSLLNKTAIIAWNTGKVFESLNYFKEAFKTEPSKPEIILNYLRVLGYLDFYKKMKEIYQQSKDKITENRNIHSTFSDYLQKNIKNKLVKRETGSEDKYLVSAIVSTYNSARFIKGCLDDLLNQTIADKLEIIVIDSNSPQNEEQLIKPYLANYPNIKYVKTRERETVYAAWNRGIRMASGKYITNANTDDRHRKDAYEIMVAELEKSPEIALVYADSYITRTENATFTDTKAIIGSFNWYEWDRKLLYIKCFMGPHPMWRREVHEEYGYFNPDYKSSGDYEFWFRISQTNKFKKINEKLGLYLEAASSIEHANHQKRLAEDNRIFSAYREAEDRGEIVNRRYPLPELPFKTAENTLETYNKIFQEVDFFIENKFNPDAVMPDTGYFILAHKWEHSSLPVSWVPVINKTVDQIWVSTNFIKRCYTASGVESEKIKVIPAGIDAELFNPQTKPAQPDTLKSFRFLFVGPFLERKGANILLEAFREEFSAADDVCLIIKDDMSEPCEKKADIIISPSQPEVIVIEDEYTAEQMAGLYNTCDCLVYPYKFPGSGVQVLKAMSSQLPVITTRGGLDFCTEENSYLIDARWTETEENKLEVFELTDNLCHFEPDKEHLKKLMRDIFTEKENAKTKVIEAQKIIENYTWSNIFNKTEAALTELKQKPVLRLNLESIKQQLLSEALNAFGQKNYSRAEELFDKLCKYDETNSDYFYNLGLSQFSRNKFDEAIDSFSACLELGDFTYELCDFLAQSLEKVGDHENAEVFFQKADELR